MTLTLQPITIDNWTDCISLSPTEEQVRASFVAPNTLSPAQAHYEPWWQPCGIYAAIDGVDVMIGFAMYGH